MLLMIGGLSAHDRVLAKTDGREARRCGRIPVGARIRDVELRPGGNIYLRIDREQGNPRRLQPLAGTL